MKTSRRKLANLVTMVILIFLGILQPLPVQAQNFSLIHQFTGHGDGGEPYAGVIVDTAGNLYGTTQTNGTDNYGSVFRLSPGGLLTTLFSFGDGPEGGAPYAGVIRDRNGILYGTTTSGGGGSCSLFGIGGCGMVFKLQIRPTVCKSVLCSWKETLLYSFLGSDDGANPSTGSLVFDPVGNLFGTTRTGGSNGCGTVYELTPAMMLTILYTFTGGADGCSPLAGVTFDGAGNLYGTTASGGTNNRGTIYQLMASGGTWTEHTLYAFQGGDDGGSPTGGLIFDQSGHNLYGATPGGGGAATGGTVFELSSSGGGWTYNVLCSFSGSNGSGPPNNLAIDSAGNLYGTTQGNFGAGDYGTVFKLSSPNWSYSLLHQFNNSDGAGPTGALAIDGQGVLYGTTYYGAIGGCRYGGCGVVFKITP